MNLDQSRILMLTAGYGDGHIQVARALQEVFLQKKISNLHIIDLMKEAHPVLNAVSAKIYKMSTFTSQLGLDYYGWSYYMTKDQHPGGVVNRSLNLLGRRTILQMIQRTRPNIIINTFPFGAVMEVAREYGIPTCTIITDYTLHSRWIHRYTDKYFVATDLLKDEMVNHHRISPERVIVTGIPVRKDFYQHGNMARLSNRNILLMASAFNSVEDIIELVNLLLMQVAGDITIICGRNDRLAYKLCSLFEGSQQVHVCGYVEQIDQIMASSACIVTKAGGVTLSEALVLKLPVFIYRPYGGQERENAMIFEQYGLAKVSNTIKDLSAKLVQFLIDPSALESTTCNQMISLDRGMATEHVVEETLLMIEEKQLSRAFRVAGK